MKKANIGGYIGITILLFVFGTVFYFIVSFVKSCNNGFGVQPGSGIGSLANIEQGKYQDEYIEKYVDSFFKIYPQYKPVPGDLAKSMTSSYEFLKMTNFYFEKYPRETYCVQWRGTGFISIRFAYNYQKNEEVIDNSKANMQVSSDEKRRIKTRFTNEILNKIDSIISKSKDSSIAIWKP